LKKEIRDNQALNSHMLNFDPVSRKFVLLDSSNSPIDPAAGAKVVLPSVAFNTGAPFENVPGCRILDSGKAEITFFAPKASRVEIAGIGGSMMGRYDMEKIEDGYWKIVLDDVGPGFHYHVYFVDGVQTVNPVLPFGFGASFVMNYFEVPLPDDDFYLLNDVPHGTIHMDIVKSAATGRYRNLWIYTPAGYEKTDKRYPVMHILHGGGENEVGWFWQGKLNYIADNLIAKGEAEEMIIVASAFAAPKELDDGSFVDDGFPEIMINEIIPFVDEHYRTIADRKHRAMSGLSAGGRMARNIAHNFPEAFGNFGQFSSGAGFAAKGVSTVPGGITFDKDGNPAPFDPPAFGDLFSTPEHYNSMFDVTFVGCGIDDPRHQYTEPQVKEFIEKGYNVKYFSYPGYHEWDVWRFCARDFMKEIFKK